MKRIAAVTALAGMVSACAPRVPIVDPASVHDQARYQRDVAECQQLASQRDVGSGAAGGAAVGTLLGAGLGAILGVAIGCPGCIGDGAAIGGATGMVSGGAGGASDTIGDQHLIMHNCLIGRGYRALD